MSTEKKSIASASDLPSTKPELTNNSQLKIISNHASTSGISAALLEMANNSQAKANFPTTTRLTSFLAPRDLTLGANSVKADKPKRVYTPNLNAQRKKKEDEPAAVQKNAKSVRNKPKGKPHERGNKHKSNLIQSTGVFSEGLAESHTKGRSGYSVYRDSNDKSEPKEMLRRPKLNAGRQVNKEEEEQKLKMILRDDFVEEDNDVEDQNCPIVLPILKEGKLLKEKVDVKIDSEIKIKVEVEEEEKTDVINNVKTKPIEDIKFKVDKEFEKKHAVNVSQSLENQTNGYFLIRFPAVLPGAQNESEEDQPRPSKSSTPSQAETKKEKTGPQPVLDNLKEGLLGKLQILQSGAARLCLGNNNFIVELGPQVFFRQDLVAVKLEDKKFKDEVEGIRSGELINLGPVHTDLRCTPDWESLT